MTRILFVTNNSMIDALAYTIVCVAAKKRKMPVTVSNVYDGFYHRDIENAFTPGAKVDLICHYPVFDAWLDSCEKEQANGMFGTLNSLAHHFDGYIPEGFVEALYALYGSEASLHLPSVLCYLLFRKMGFIEFGNFIAQKLTENLTWDICRDPEVVDILDPKEERHVQMPSL